MRIMTSGTTDPWIVAVTPAVENAVGLEANVVDVSPIWQLEDIVDATVARAAELLRKHIRREATRIEDLLVQLASFDGSDVPFTWPVTRLTPDTGFQPVDAHLISGYRSR
jgi:hypothetical protein